MYPLFCNNTPQSITSIADNCPIYGNNIAHLCTCIGILQVCNHNTATHHCKNGWALALEIVDIVGSIPGKTFPVTWTGHVACPGGCTWNNSPGNFGAGSVGKKYNTLSILHANPDDRNIHSKMALMHELAHCFGADDNGEGDPCDDPDHCIISYSHKMDEMNAMPYSEWFCTKHKNQILNYLANHGF